MLYPYVEPRRHIMRLTKEKEAQLAKLMKDYNASDIEELMDILPDLVLEDEDKLPQQEEVDLDKVILVKEPAVLVADPSCPFASFPFPFN